MCHTALIVADLLSLTHLVVRFGYGEFGFIDFAPDQFETLRSLFGLDSEQYIQSIQYSLHENGLRMQVRLPSPKVSF